MRAVHALGRKRHCRYRLNIPSDRLGIVHNAMTPTLLLPRWLLGLALVCGMFFTPLTMATARAMSPAADQTASHCTGGDAAQHPMAKQLLCLGACSGIEVGVAQLTARLAAPLAAIPIPAVSSLSDILLERATPPPRLT